MLDRILPQARGIFSFGFFAANFTYLSAPYGATYLHLYYSTALLKWSLSFTKHYRATFDFIVILQVVFVRQEPSRALRSRKHPEPVHSDSESILGVEDASR
jgi:hypothetical protein